MVDLVELEAEVLVALQKVKIETKPSNQAVADLPTTIGTVQVAENDITGVLFMAKSL